MNLRAKSHHREGGVLYPIILGFGPRVIGCAAAENDRIEFLHLAASDIVLTDISSQGNKNMYNTY